MPIRATDSDYKNCSYYIIGYSETTFIVTNMAKQTYFSSDIYLYIW